MARYSIIIAVEFLRPIWHEVTSYTRLFDETIQKKYSNNTSALLLLAVYIPVCKRNINM